MHVKPIKKFVKVFLDYNYSLLKAGNKHPRLLKFDFH